MSECIYFPLPYGYYDQPAVTKICIMNIGLGVKILTYSSSVCLSSSVNMRSKKGLGNCGPCTVLNPFPPDFFQASRVCIVPVFVFQPGR